MEDKKGRNNNSRKELNIVFSFWIVVGKIENVCVCVCILEMGLLFGHLSISIDVDCLGRMPMVCSLGLNIS